MKRLFAVVAIAALPTVAHAQCEQPADEHFKASPGLARSFALCLHNQQARAMNAQTAALKELSGISNNHAAALEAIREQNTRLQQLLIEMNGFLNDTVLENQDLTRRVELLETKTERLEDIIRGLPRE